MYRQDNIDVTSDNNNRIQRQDDIDENSDNNNRM
jgi:hypothetical protein